MSLAREFAGKASLAVGTNVISLVVSVLVTLVVPRFVGVKEFGYFQLYLFYSSYVGLLHLGWPDGVLLRYGGRQYAVLDKDLFFSQFYMLVFQQMVAATSVFVLAELSISDPNENFIFRMLAVGILLTSPAGLLTYVLQATSRIREYAAVVLLGRSLFLSSVVAVLASGAETHHALIVADLVARAGSAILAAFYCREIVFRRMCSFRLTFAEAFENIRAGSKLMIAFMAGALVIGAVRFGIQAGWSVEVFAKVSLSLSVANMALTAVAAVGAVAFPLLRRLDTARLPSTYVKSRDLATATLLALLMMFYPLRAFLHSWLPDYRDSLLYLGLLFPMFVYQIRGSLVAEAYLKTLRRENAILIVNVCALAFSVIATFVTVFWLGDLNAAVLSITVAVGLKSTLAEVTVSRVLGVPIARSMAWVHCMVICFVAATWLLNPWLAGGAYAIAYVAYSIVNWRQIVEGVESLRRRRR